jgi:hypothetical protein
MRKSLGLGAVTGTYVKPKRLPSELLSLRPAFSVH